MFLRQQFKTVNGRRRAYWTLVESCRTAQGPRQRVVAWLGQLDQAGRLGVQQAADDQSAADRQPTLFDEPEPTPRWVEVDTAKVRVENCRQFGGPWLGLELIRRLGLDEFFADVMPSGQESVPWSVSALILIIARLCEPSSELSISERWYPRTALPDLLGVPRARVDDNRMDRALDQLLPHKEALEALLKNRLGELFDLEYDLLLYDVATVEHIVETMEAGYGWSDRIGVMDRGLHGRLLAVGVAGEGRRQSRRHVQNHPSTAVSEENIPFLKQGRRRDVVGTPQPMLKQFEQELLKEDWREVRSGVEVKLGQSPDDAAETFILCRSRDRSQKDLGIVRRFEQKIAAWLTKMAERCVRQKRDP